MAQYITHTQLSYALDRDGLVPLKTAVTLMDASISKHLEAVHTHLAWHHMRGAREQSFSGRIAFSKT